MQFPREMTLITSNSSDLIGDPTSLVHRESSLGIQSPHQLLIKLLLY